MSDYKERLVQQLKNAIEAVEESGEDCCICDGLDIAINIVKAGLDSDAKKLVQVYLVDFGV